MTENVLEIGFPEFRNMTGLADVPFLNHWLGPWAMYPESLDQLQRMFSTLDLAAHLQAVEQRVGGSDDDRRLRGDVRNGVGMLEISGTIMKQRPSFGGGTSTVEARQAFRELLRDPAADSILLVFDTPGGSALATPELADEIYKARGTKRIVSLCDGLCASAGYYLGSQADEFYAVPGSITGSIGTFTVVQDWSRAYAEAGVDVELIASGHLKGSAMGAAISDDKKNAVREMVLSMQELFSEAVQRGRNENASVVKSWSTGQAWTARQAVELGLIDGIKTFDELFAELTGAASAGRNPKLQRGSKMTTQTETETPQAATLAELKTAFPKAGSDFYLAQIEAGATLAKAKDGWISELEATVESLETLNADNETKIGELESTVKTLETDLAAAKTKPRGVTPTAQTENGGGDSGGDAVSEFRKLVAEKMQSGMSRPQAVSAVNRENPELQKQVVAAAN